MAWFDGADDVVIGKKVGGVFSEVGRTAFNWGVSDATWQFALTAIGLVISVSIDGETMLNRTINDLQSNTLVGLFSRGPSGNAFNDFQAKTE